MASPFPTERDDICPHTVKAPKYFLTPLRGEIALNIGNPKNQNAQQHRDFGRVIEEEPRGRTVSFRPGRDTPVPITSPRKVWSAA